MLRVPSVWEQCETMNKISKLMKVNILTLSKLHFKAHKNVKQQPGSYHKLMSLPEHSLFTLT